MPTQRRHQNRWFGLQRFPEWAGAVSLNSKRYPFLDLPWNCSRSHLFEGSRCMGLWLLCMGASWGRPTFPPKVRWLGRTFYHNHTRSRAQDFIKVVRRLCWLLLQVSAKESEGALELYKTAQPRVYGWCRAVPRAVGCWICRVASKPLKKIAHLDVFVLLTNVQKRPLYTTLRKSASNLRILT